MKKNSVAQKRQLNFFAGKKRLGTSKNWDIIMVDLGNGKRKNLVI